MKSVSTYIIIILTALVVWLLLKPKETIVELLAPEKVVETRIEYKERTIKEIEVEVVEVMVANDTLEYRVEVLEDSLEAAREARDTIKIIQWQDTTITTLKVSKDTLKRVIELKDSIILNKDYIIKSKDTLAFIDERKIKKHRRRSLILGALSAVLLTVSIAK